MRTQVKIFLLWNFDCLTVLDPRSVRLLHVRGTAPLIQIYPTATANDTLRDLDSFPIVRPRDCDTIYAGHKTSTPTR